MSLLNKEIWLALYIIVIDNFLYDSNKTFLAVLGARSLLLEKKKTTVILLSSIFVNWYLKLKKISSYGRSRRLTQGLVHLG